MVLTYMSVFKYSCFYLYIILDSDMVLTYMSVFKYWCNHLCAEHDQRYVTHVNGIYSKTFTSSTSTFMSSLVCYRYLKIITCLHETCISRWSHALTYPNNHKIACKLKKIDIITCLHEKCFEKFQRMYRELYMYVCMYDVCIESYTCRSTVFQDLLMHACMCVCVRACTYIYIYIYIYIYFECTSIYIYIHECVNASNTIQ